MTARRIGLVAWHVFKESVRDRVLYAIAGRWREVHPIMYALGAIAIGLLALEHGTLG